MSVDAPSAPRGRVSPFGPIGWGLVVAVLGVASWWALSLLLSFPCSDEKIPLAAILTGYGVMAAGLVRRQLRACLHALGPLAGSLAEDPDAAVDRFFSVSTWRAGALTGAVLGALLAVLDPQEGIGFRNQHFWRLDLVYWVPMLVLLFGVIGAGVSTMLRVTRELVSMGRRMQGLDLLALDRLEPLASYALRTSLLWIVGTSIASLTAVQGQLTAAIGVLLAGVLVMAVAVLLLPLRGVRVRVHEVKREELARVDDALREARADLLDGRQARPALAELLAWRAFVAARPEWPLDAGSFARLALYVAIGVGSWVGAALVERALDLAIR